MPRSLQQSLAEFRPGDVIHGTSHKGASLILLVMAMTPDTVDCRHITSGYSMRFDRLTGKLLPKQLPDQPEIWIDSIYPLPREFHDAFIDMDRTYRCVDVDVYPTGYHLTDIQKQALLFIGEFYRTHPITGPIPTKQENAPDNEPRSVQDALLDAFKLL